MAGRKLTSNVWVNGTLHLAGSSPEKDVADQITNPNAWSAEDEAEGPRYPEGDPSEQWTGKQLDAYGEDHQVDVSGFGKKADKLAAIQAAASV